MPIDKLSKSRPEAAENSSESRVLQLVGVPAGGRHRAKPDGAGYGPVFESLQQAMVTKVSPVAAAAAAGRRLAERGVALADALDAMQHACNTIDREPGYDAMRSLCQSWTECTFTYLSGPSCEDPSTGLATAQHLLSRLSDLYRTAMREVECLPETHVLVVVEPITRQRLDAELTTLAASVLEVFGGTVVGRLGSFRIAAVVALDAHFVERLGRLRSAIGYWPGPDRHSTTGNPRTKVWTEQLPTLPEWSESFIKDLTKP
ncbi:hypothetical protein [Kribbella sp. NPDC048928]|uniref:hypothetical protein n=1 Tax=Kribbella sp. NPDC048928 TaxID=3364111 RepID=UPI00371F395B